MLKKHGKEKTILKLQDFIATLKYEIGESKSWFKKETLRGNECGKYVKKNGLFLLNIYL